MNNGLLLIQLVNPFQDKIKLMRNHYIVPTHLLLLGSIVNKINNIPVVVSSSGSFQKQITLKEGENKIKIVAVDRAGNIETKEIKVIYEKDD